MKNYQSQTPRAAIAAVAVLLSVATMGLMVGAPAAAGGEDYATSLARSGGAREVTITPARIDVIATREQAVIVAAASMPHVDSQR